MIGRVLAVALLGLAALAAPARAQTSERAEVVVELFTSQGCTQCPRANRLLGMFAREEGVLALTFAVGIWDYLGWRDTFAHPEFNERQRAYTRALRARGRFTPQLVIDGAEQLSASDWDEARATLTRAKAQPLPLAAGDLSITRLRGGRVRVTLGAHAPANGADIWLVSYDPGPITVTVTGGVNVNRSVTHYNLALDIERIGVWDGAPRWFERARCTPACAVIVQAPQGGAIYGAAYTRGR